MSNKKENMTEAKTPIQWDDLQIGNWYQCRFEFQEASLDLPKLAADFPSEPARTTKNKSHRILLRQKLGNEEKIAVCLYLTSFGGSKKTPADFVKDHRFIHYIPVNMQPNPPETPFFINIPVSAPQIYGYLNWVEMQHLPCAGVPKGRRIVNAPESLDPVTNGGVRITSPAWVIPYLEKLQRAWFDHLLSENNLDNMVRACFRIRKDFEYIVGGLATKKRAQSGDGLDELVGVIHGHSDSYSEEEVSKGDCGVSDIDSLKCMKGNNVPKEGKGCEGSWYGQRASIAPEEDEGCENNVYGHKGSGEHGFFLDGYDGSGVHDMDSEEGNIGTVIEGPEKFEETNNDTTDGCDTDDDDITQPIYTKAKLINVSFFEIDPTGDGETDVVDFKLLRELFGRSLF